MVSQRGVLNLYHSDAQRDAYARRGNAMRMHGVDAELLDTTGVRRMLPFLARAYRLDRFASGHLIDENGQGAQPNLH
jgi:glycine/D-amino acid oxidase-like deaminating enzyme